MNKARTGRVAALAITTAALGLGAAETASAERPPGTINIICEAPHYLLVVRGEVVAQLPGTCADGQAWPIKYSNITL